MIRGMLSVAEVYQRILEAADAGRGVRLSAHEVELIAQDDAVIQAYCCGS